MLLFNGMNCRCPLPPLIMSWRCLASFSPFVNCFSQKSRGGGGERLTSVMDFSLSRSGFFLTSLCFFAKNIWKCEIPEKMFSLTTPLCVFSCRQTSKVRRRQRTKFPRPFNYVEGDEGRQLWVEKMKTIFGEENNSRTHRETCLMLTWEPQLTAVSSVIPTSELIKITSKVFASSSRARFSEASR